MTKILITGANGMLGNELSTLFPDAYAMGSEDFDLTNPNEALAIVERFYPDLIIHCAAKVGGIIGNMNDPVGYFEENILMNTNLLRAAHEFKVPRFVGIASTCIYPDKASQYPMQEETILNGLPQETNLAYAFAKRAMIVQIQSYIKQYGYKWNYLIPSNLYGENDVFEGDRSHFISALIKKVFEAKDVVHLFGTGKPLRQFMYTKDLAALIKMMIDDDCYQSLNIAPPYQHTINGMAEMCIRISEKRLRIEYDKTKPDGQLRRDVDTTKLMSLYPNFKFTPLEEGMRRVYDSFSKRHN